MAHEKATAWDDGQLLSMQVVAQVQGVLERFQVAIAQQIQQLGMQQQYHQAMHQQMLQVLQQQQEQKALLQRSREEGTSQSTTRGHWPQVYMQPPAGQHPALSKQPLLQLPPLLQSIPTAKSERPIRKPRAAKSQAEEKLSERPNRQVSPGSCRDEVQNEEPKLEKDDENVQNVMDMKVSEAEAKATEVVEVVEMDVSVAQPMAEGTPEKAQVVQVVQVAERQNAPDTQSSADAEYMSRIERCHEEAMKKVQVATEEAEESKEKDESNVEESEEATSGGALLGSAKSRNEVHGLHGIHGRRGKTGKTGKTGPRSSEVIEVPLRGSTRGKMNRRSGEVGEMRCEMRWRPRYR